MLLKNKISKLTAAIILVIIVIVFIDSELGQRGCKSNSEQDYCEIVKGAATQLNKDVTVSVVKLQIDKSICLHCVNETSEHNSSYINSDFEQFHFPQKTTQVYLHNRVFLI